MTFEEKEKIAISFAKTIRDGANIYIAFLEALKRDMPSIYTVHIRLLYAAYTEGLTFDETLIAETIGMKMGEEINPDIPSSFNEEAEKGVQAQKERESNK